MINGEMRMGSFDNDYGMALLALVAADGGVSPEEQAALDGAEACFAWEVAGESYLTRPFADLTLLERKRVFEDLALVAACDGEVHETEERFLRELASGFDLDSDWVDMALDLARKIADRILSEAEPPEAALSTRPRDARFRRAIGAVGRWMSNFGGTVAEETGGAVAGAAAGSAASAVAYAGLSGTLLKAGVALGIASPPTLVVVAPGVGAAAGIVTVRQVRRLMERRVSKQSFE